MASTMRLTTNQKMPVLADGGALVVEATLAGCVLAWRLAHGGCRTVLATSGSSLAHELVVVRRPWARAGQWRDLPEPFISVFERAAIETTDDGVTLLNLAKLAVGIEDVLLDAGVQLFYGLAPCGVEQSGAQTRGVVFGGKGGLQIIRAERIVDCTTTAQVARLSGATLQRRNSAKRGVVARLGVKVLQAGRPGPLAITRGQVSADKLETPDVNELDDGNLVLHGPYTQVALKLPVDTDDPLWPARLSVAMRTQLIDIGRRVNDDRAANNQVPLYFHRFGGGLMLDPLLRAKVPAASNLFMCGPAADVDDRTAKRLADPFHAACVTSADDILAHRAKRPQKTTIRLTAAPARATRKADAKFTFTDAPSLHAQQYVVLPKNIALPSIAQCDVLITGGGTAGVPAAQAAADAGAKTLLVEGQADLGGVRTVGGVGSYWFGRTTPFQKGCDDAYDQVVTRTGMAEELAMMQGLIDAGVDVVSPCPIVGVARDGDRITGVAIITAHGLAMVGGEIVIDATGDADVAAWGGAPFDYGNGRDAWTLWASFANFNREKRVASRLYESAIEVRDPRDFTRTIVCGRRRPGMWRRIEHEMPQHYVAPRESRRIRADATVTYAGIMAGQTFGDTMVVCESNFDIKGIATSDAGACGAVSSWRVHTKFQAAVPYRAIHPQGLSNVMVVGRSYAASHDALALARMQRDMVSLGGAAGIAAAWAVEQDVAPAHLDVAALQAEWLARGMIRADDLNRYGKAEPRYTREIADRDVRRLVAGRGRASSLMAQLMRSRAGVTPLRQAFGKTKKASVKTRIARVLASHGDRQAVKYLIETIERQTARGLPRPRKCTLAIPPEHGWAGEPVYSIHAIARSGHARLAAETLTKIATRIEDRAERYASKDDSQFEYVLAICAAVERDPCPEMVKPLDVLLIRESLRNLSIPVSRDPRFAEEPVQERRAYLELCIGRALARCGERRGYDILMRYVDDVRGTLARSAREELAELLGDPLPDDPAARRRAFEKLPDQPQPFTRRID